MAQINAKLVKQLRDKTGAGMGDCKKALIETDGDVDAAVDYLRSKGVKESQATRAATEGAIAIKVSDDGQSAAIVELHCETDFAARSDNFRKLLDTIVDAVLEHKPDSVEATKALDSVSKGLQDAAAVTIRENIVLAQAEHKALDGDGRMTAYVHHNGMVGTLVAAKSDASVAGKPELDGVLRDVAMHATAHDPSPVAVDRDSIDKDIVEREKAIYQRQMDDDPSNAKKPENVKQKIIDGKLRKFFEERALLEQKFVKNPELSVRDLLAQAGKDLGGEVSVSWFTRLQVG
jgi:elongation factor Ts